MGYVFLDCEMGGLEKEKYSLLTTYLLFTDDNFNFVSDLNLILRPNDGIYKVCGEAMNVNRIDLKVHDTMAITYKEGGTKLYKWLQSITGNIPDSYGPRTETAHVRATIVGHGVYGDVEWICHHLMSKATWETFTSYRKLDTSAVCQFLKACNMFPEDVSGSLISLAKHFNIPVDENCVHDAKYDTELTFKVFMALRQDLMVDYPFREWAPPMA